MPDLLMSKSENLRPEAIYAERGGCCVCGKAATRKQIKTNIWAVPGVDRALTQTRIDLFCSTCTEEDARFYSPAVRAQA